MNTQNHPGGQYLSIFKGKYYNNNGHAISDEFNIYHGSKAKCKTSNIENASVGVICNDYAPINNADSVVIYNTDHLSNPIRESISVFSVLSTENTEKSSWIRLPPSRNIETFDVLNFDNNNFIVAITHSSKQIYMAIINTSHIPTITDITYFINNENEIHLTKTGGNEFLISFHETNTIVAQKFNTNGQPLGELISIVNKIPFSTYSAYHLNHFSQSRYVIGWKHTEEKCYIHHDCYREDHIWTDFQTSIYMNIYPIDTPQIQGIATTTLDII